MLSAKFPIPKMNFGPASYARFERAKARAVMTVDSSGNSFGILQADHLDGSVPISTELVHQLRKGECARM